MWDVLPILVFCGTLGVKPCEDEGMKIVTVDEWIAFKMDDKEVASLEKVRTLVHPAPPTHTNNLTGGAIFSPRSPADEGKDGRGVHQIYRKQREIKQR